MDQDQRILTYWSISPSELLQGLGTMPAGLSEEEAARRLNTYGPNLLKPKRKKDTLSLLAGQFKSPIIIILLCAVALSFFLHDTTDALIILAIVLVSALLGFWQEKGAADSVAKLLLMIEVKAMVLRDGNAREVPIADIVPGDVITLAAGDVIPGDCLILESRDLFVDEAALTGETYPVEKTVEVLPKEISLAQRTNSLLMGTHVVSGRAKAVVVHTGLKTEFGKISEHLRLKAPETEFEHGIRRFGYFLMEVTFTMVFTIFAINVFLARPILDSFLFALALAVGLTPQLLPAIISINLSHGAKAMSARKVIVKRLASIENFGSMNVLCSDKTGTLTEGEVHVRSAVDVNERESNKVFLYAYLNASYETGFINPIDKAIRNHRALDISRYGKLDEVPYDFIRRRLSILASTGSGSLMITKGTVSSVLDACSWAEIPDGTIVSIFEKKDHIKAYLEKLSNEGFRVLGVAYRHFHSALIISKEDEREMVFLGFLTLFDPPKPDVSEAISKMNHLGVRLKIITGDNRWVAASVSRQVGLVNPKLLTGSDLQKIGDSAFLQRVQDVDIFSEVEPNQKERIILALRKAGNVVGFMGDGINDASALHAADVGISVDRAVDVAKEAADIVLLEKDLGVLVQGIIEGRRTFANTLKYVFMATSANFGNMFSMAGASLFLPFLPMLPKQILLTNLMTDFPEMTIATDSIDPEMVEAPRRWNVRFIRNFMIVFGALSSVFDYITFGVLIFILGAGADEFRTGWFLESVVSASIIVLVIRSRRPFFRSRPGKYLLRATLAVVGTAFILPFLSLQTIFGFRPLPLSFLLGMCLIVALYIASAEAAKRLFYKWVR